MTKEVIRFAWRLKGVPEYLVKGVMSPYKVCKTAFSVDGELSSSFSLKAGVHQKSVLTLILFIMVVDVLTEDVRDGSLMELLDTGGLVLCEESLNEVMEKYRRWKNEVEGKCLRMNQDKTQGMQLLLGTKIVFRKKIHVVSLVSGLFVILFSVPNVRGGFIVIFLMCLGGLLSCRDVFVCRTCLGHNCSIEEKSEFKRCEDVLKEVEKYCYLGDMISCYGGASEVVSARIGSENIKSCGVKLRVGLRIYL